MIFRPLYYNQKKSFGERSSALENEKNSRKLKAAALNSGLDDRLRAIAIKQLKDSDICEVVLMEYSSGNPMEGPQKGFEERFNASAKVLKELGEQKKLEAILDKCVSHRIQAIIVRYIEDEALLEKAAFNEKETYGPWYIGVSNNAIETIQNEEILAKIAIGGMDGHASEDSAKKVKRKDLLQKIVIESKDISARVNAVCRLNDTSAVLPILRKEMAPVIIDKPLNSFWEIRLLASARDKTGRVMAYCTERPGLLQENYQDTIRDREVLDAEVDIIYPFLRNLFRELMDKKDTKAWDMIPKISDCIKLLHDNGVMTDQIENDFPKTLDYACNVISYSGDDYNSRYSTERRNILTFW